MGESTVQMTAPDLDGDGRPDVVFTTGSSSPNLDIADGLGNGSFGMDATSSTAAGYAGQIASGDVNGDGLEDVAVGSTGGAFLSILLGVPNLGMTAVAPARERTTLDLAIRPNPARTTAHIDFALPVDSRVYVEIIDLGGRRVAEVFRGSLPPGAHSLTWNGRQGAAPVRPGVYFARVNAGALQATKWLVWIP